MGSNESVIEVSDLRKTYRTGFTRRAVHAVKSVSLSVHRGEIFGFLGPNGAGKTTTIRVLMGLIRASSGTAKIFGHEIPSRAARMRLGFLPESPYFYDYLSVHELLDLTGRLFGMSRRERRERAGELIARVGLEHAKTKPLKSYSKGMLQRAGIASALMNDPELVVFDEPMTGLDPIGRKEVRDLIFSLRDSGKTVFFSSHILADVETVADRIGIVVRGELQAVGTMAELVTGTLERTDVALRLPEDRADAVAKQLSEAGTTSRRRGLELWVPLAPGVDVDEFLAMARESGARVQSVIPHHETLEDVFIRRAGATPTDGETESRN